MKRTQEDGPVGKSLGPADVRELRVPALVQRMSVPCAPVAPILGGGAERGGSLGLAGQVVEPQTPRETGSVEDPCPKD